MQANKHFTSLGADFWGYIRFLGDTLGYSKKRKIITYSKQNIIDCLNENNLTISEDMLNEVVNYLDYRKEILTNFVEPHLMNADEAQEKYYALKKETDTLPYTFLSPQPMNKQKGDKRNPAFFTCSINLLTEKAIHSYNTEHGTHITCDYDPRHLTVITSKDANHQNHIADTYSRRFDGAIPSLYNPVSIWEIKEYYYTTTFGSRIADGVYETQLDGYEVRKTKEAKPIHCFLIDGYYTWWVLGKSYLCRIIDTLNMGLVNEVIFGKEIFETWPQKVKSFCKLEDQKN